MNVSQIVVLILICFSTMLAAACNPLPARSPEAYEAEMDKWKGKPLDDLKRSWGPPIAETRLDSNSHRLVQFRRHLPMGIARGRCDTTFEVDTSNIIVNHSSKGPACKLRPNVKGR